MIKINNVYKSYRSISNISCNVLNDLTLSVESGKMTAIVGVSGAGKSTLLNILSCIEKYDSGSITVDGTELAKLDERESAIYRNSTIGIVLQSFALVNDFSAYENIILPLRFSKELISKRQMREKANIIARQLGIKSLLSKSVFELSGGEKQRVAIARALINAPKYVFADEPTGALDSENTKKIVDVLRNIANSGRGVIIVTHGKSVSSACDAIFEMKDGKIVESGSHTELLNKNGFYAELYNSQFAH